MEERPVPKSIVPGEADRADAAVSAQAAAARPDCLLLFGEGLLHADGGARGVLPGAVEDQHDVHRGPYTPTAVDRMMVTFPSTLGGGSWSGLSDGPSRSRSRVHECHEPWARWQRWCPPRRATADPTMWVRRHPLGRRGRTILESRNSGIPVFDAAVRRADRPRREPWRGRLESASWIRRSRSRPKDLEQTGTLSIGGSIATAGGLIFIGATIDCRFRAFESQTGKQLWETELPACAHATPITFLGKDRRQYIVSGRRWRQLSRCGAGTKLVAFALPAEK